MRNEGTELVDADTGGVERPLRDRSHLRDGPPEDGLTGHPERGGWQGFTCREGVLDLRVVRLLGDGLNVRTVAAPHHRTDARRLARADNSSTSTVTEEERHAAVVRVDEVGHLLRPDHDDVACTATANRVVGDRKCIGEPGAGGVDVHRAGVDRAETVLDFARAAGRLVGVRAGREQDEVDLFGRYT